MPDPEEVVAPAVIAETSPVAAAPAVPDPVIAAPADANPPAAPASAPVEAAPAATEAAPTLLHEYDTAKAAEKPAAEAPKADGLPKLADPAAAAPADGSVAVVDGAPSAELAKLDYFAPEVGLKLPETLQMDDGQRSEFTGALDAFRADPMKGGQALLDLAAKSFGDMAQKLQADQWKAFADTNQTWRTQVMADPVLGGAGHDTAMALVAQARNNLVSSAKPDSPQYQKELGEFNNMMLATGVGNHPAFLRLLHNAARYVREAPLPPENPKPTKDAGRAPGRKGLGSIYTHPTSNPDH